MEERFPVEGGVRVPQIAGRRVGPPEPRGGATARARARALSCCYGNASTPRALAAVCAADAAEAQSQGELLRW